MKTRQHFVVPSAVLAAGLALLGGCAGESSETSAAAGEGETSPSARPSVPPTELKKPEPRLVLTYDGGLLTLDAQTLDVIDDTQLDGFNRVNPAGDGRHVMVTAGNEFRLFDAGSWTEPHGDHSHSYSVPPGMTDTSFPSDKPGHVIHHGQSTVLFGDGDGKMQILDPEKLSDADPQPRIVEAEAPHHGAAVQLDTGELIHTVGTEEERSGVVVRDQEGRETARNEDCPGVHGEAAAKDDVIAFGCENGILYYSQGKFTKVDSTDEYGRIGNQAGDENSSVILGDYKVDEDAELERPERVSLTDTRTGHLKLVDLGTSYSFRSLDRGPEGEALVLGTDGQLHVIDAESGREESVIPVVDKWTEPLEWQEARPTLYVQGKNAYVSEPAKKTLHVVDLESGKVTKSKELPHASDEITGVTG
ncbi:zinc metallochaperone AztD [Brevibacterium sp.]|uniref:zinc metallochaperone AztD n=1 Tax=Brevibacterium sp. TaxID=1701 RepID=UPI002811DDCE|nr:zinc metallochaperone AztD [Brevibacterium sp.]